MAEGRKCTACRVCGLPHLFRAVLSVAGAKRPISSCCAGSCGAQVPGEVCRDTGEQAPLSGVRGRFALAQPTGRTPMTLQGGTSALRSKNLPSGAWSL